MASTVDVVGWGKLEGGGMGLMDWPAILISF